MPDGARRRRRDGTLARGVGGARGGQHTLRMRWAGGLWWATGLVLVVVAGVAVWRAQTKMPADESTLPVGARTAAPLAPAVTPALPTPATPPPTSPVAQPPGLDAAQWASLQRELAGRPAELHRVVAYLGFADALRHFRSGSGDRYKLAQRIDAGLDERLHQRELSAEEARLIKVAVLEVLETDPGRRTESLARWEAAQALPPAKPSAAEAEFKRRQATVVAAWNALPTEARDPSALARQLDTLRVQIFETSSTQDTGGSR
jgi:hypothetical protein